MRGSSPYSPSFEIVPDIAESVDVDGTRVFTFHLAAGPKWSDGEPFTSDDFRFYWEDIANDPEGVTLRSAEGAAGRRREAAGRVP